VFLVFWGSWWEHHGSDVQQYLANYFSGLGIGEKWTPILNQYTDSDGGPGLGSEAVLYGGSLNTGALIVHSDPPHAATKAQLAEEAYLAITHIYGNNIKHTREIIPIVVSPSGFDPAGYLERNICAEHDWATHFDSASGTTYYFPYVNMPWQPDSGRGCSYGKGVNAGFSISAGHEFAEVVTDPFVNSGAFPGTGWASHTSPADEVADHCFGGAKQSNIFVLKLGTGDFPSQKLWDNSRSTCVSRIR